MHAVAGGMCGGVRAGLQVAPRPPHGPLLGQVQPVHPLWQGMQGSVLCRRERWHGGLAVAAPPRQQGEANVSQVRHLVVWEPVGGLWQGVWKRGEAGLLWGEPLGGSTVRAVGVGGELALPGGVWQGPRAS